ncbi:MAG: LCP family protein [Clostridia bacterium]|nr:LCP family protein [Clostridia bacterium]
MKNKSKKIGKAGIVIIAVVAVIIAAIVGVMIYLYSMYNKIYVPVDIVDRSDTYSMPEYPSLETAPAETETAVTTEAETEGAPETLPYEENPPSQWKPNYNSDASFGNSPNAIPVYGGVPIYKVAQKDPNITNILLIGTDSRDVTMDRGRSDTMIVLSYNKSSGEMKMVSFMRDSLVPIEGCDWNKLNSAYAFGGVGLCINTINQLFDLDVQKFVVIDMNGTEDFIDRIGGLDIYLTQTQADYYNKYYGMKVTEGVNHLNGDNTMLHLRHRMTDSDFGRTKRQREVISEIISKVLSSGSLKEVLDLVDFTSNIVKTNIDMVSMTELVTQVVSNKDKLSIDAQNVPFSDAYGSAWYNGMQVLSFDIERAAARLNEYLY